MKEFKTIMVCGKTHVVCRIEDRPNESKRKDGSTVTIEQPNYLGLGVALCGVLKENETLEKWIKKQQKWNL